MNATRAIPTRSIAQDAVRRGSLVHAVLACALACGPAIAADTYRFDPVHSQLWFSTSHQAFSNPQGRLRIRDGWFRFDPKDWAAAHVDVVVDLASVDLGDDKWNDTVKSAQFLDTQRFATARYVADGAERIDDAHGVLHGTLAFRGESRRVDVAFTLNRIATDPYLFRRKAGFSASAELVRADFGMARYKDVVGAKIALRMEIEGIADRDAGSQDGGR